MASTDAITVPKYATAYRMQFGIQNGASNGALIPSATGVAATIVKDGGTQVSTTNSPSQIGTTGLYTLDLTATEMTCTSALVVVTSTSTGAVPVIREINPQTTGSIPVDVNSITGSTAAAAGLSATSQAVVTGTVVTTNFTPTTTEFETSLTASTLGLYRNRVVIFTSGANKGFAAAIADYQYITANGYIFCGALPSAPASGDSFVII